MESLQRYPAPIKRLLILAFAFLPFAAVGQAPAGGGGDVRLDSTELRGTVGDYRVGLNYTVRQHTELTAAHYFYMTQLKDIALKGGVHGESIDLEGADGSIFHLHFVGNGSQGMQPLTFENSVGLSGSWTLGQRNLPVRLTVQHSTANPGERFYAQATGQPDRDYEAMVAKAREAILGGNAGGTTRFVHFPLRVNDGRASRSVRNAAELKTGWSWIFTPGLLAKLRTAVPHEMFVHNGQVMLGDGELWFDDKGLVSVNVPRGKE